MAWTVYVGWPGRWLTPLSILASCSFLIYGKLKWWLRLKCRTFCEYPFVVPTGNRTFGSEQFKGQVLIRTKQWNPMIQRQGFPHRLWRARSNFRRWLLSNFISPSPHQLWPPWSWELESPTAGLLLHLTHRASQAPEEDLITFLFVLVKGQVHEFTHRKPDTANTQIGKVVVERLSKSSNKTHTMVEGCSDYRSNHSPDPGLRDTMVVPAHCINCNHLLEGFYLILNCFETFGLQRFSARMLFQQQIPAVSCWQESHERQQTVILTLFTWCERVITDRHRTGTIVRLPGAAAVHVLIQARPS